MSLSGALPQDVNGLRFAGPAGLLPSGTQVGATDYAIQHVTLYDAAGNALLYAVDLDSGAGIAYRVGMALLVPASGGPAVVPGDGTNGLMVQQTASVLPAGGTPTAGSTTLNLTTVTQLAANQPCKSVLVQSRPSNSVSSIILGAASGQTIRLSAGDVIVLPVSNVNLLYALNALSGTQTLDWLAIS